jgi:hypothetical protein
LGWYFSELQVAVVLLRIYNNPIDIIAAFDVEAFASEHSDDRLLQMTI